MYRLRVENGCRAGDHIPLPLEATGPLLLGRGYQAGIRFPNDATMSRVHGELFQRDGRWHVRNHSQHGVLVGRRRVDGESPLAPGDVFVLGDTRVAFEADAAVTPAAHDPLTPQTPTIAAPPSAAGYDTEGVFHMGQTLLGSPAGDTSFIWLSSRPAEGSTSGGLRIKTRRVYFYAVVLLLGLTGCLSTGLIIILPTLLAQPVALLTAAAFALLPAIPYLLLIKALDRNDQIPWHNILSCLVWGATVGCGVSLILNSIGIRFLSALFSPAAAQDLTATLVAPVVEECVKGLGVLVVFWILHDEFDNVLEGMVLGAASGLGFALVENIVYDVTFLAQGGTLTLLVMGTFRTLINALIGHPVYTAMTGAGLGLLRETARSNPVRYLFPPLGLFLAILLHFAWNGAAVFLSGLLGASNPLLGLAITTVVFGGLGLFSFLVAYLFAASRERRVLLNYLSEEVGRGFVEPDELASFRRLFGRQRYELEGLIRGGFGLYLLRRSLRRAQVELAFRKWHLAKGDAVRGQEVDAYVHAARIRIRDARNRLNGLERRLGITTTAPLKPLPARSDDTERPGGGVGTPN